MNWDESDDFDYAFFTEIWGPELNRTRRRLPWRERRRLRRLIARAQFLYQRMFDELVDSARGMDPAEVAPSVEFAFAEIGRTLTPAELRSYTRRAIRGRRIVLPPLFPDI